MQKYLNRLDAGAQLAPLLQTYRGRQDVIVLALPRGGVPVGYVIAEFLNVPLDVFIVRKLGVPDQEELAMGAIASGGLSELNESVIKNLEISPQEIVAVQKKELAELMRREHAYRGNKPALQLKNKTVILVDDGIATGASMRVAIKALKQAHPIKIVVAVPVAAEEQCVELEALADEVVCPLQPENLYAVGTWYEDFSQTEDTEVQDFLNKSISNG